MFIKTILKRQADSYISGGLANRLRKRRMKCFEEFFWHCFEDRIIQGEIINIVDVGGDYRFWKTMDFKYIDSVSIMLINICKKGSPDDFDNITSTIGDATNMGEILDLQYDLAFSNSCIEHVGKEEEWAKMASEMKRIASHIFLQTPNKYFPIEPHFLFPLFQFFPTIVRAAMVRFFQLGFWPRAKSWKEALTIADEITLLSYSDLRRLFPEASIQREKMLGITKSFMVFM